MKTKFPVLSIHISPAGHQDEGHTLDPAGRADETKPTGDGGVGGLLCVFSSIKDEDGGIFFLPDTDVVKRS